MHWHPRPGLEHAKSRGALSVKENALRVSNHLVRERNRDLAETLKEEALQSASYECRVCGLRPYDLYGEAGRAALECHHIVPLAELDGESETRLDDLALVCACCHRVLHAVCEPRSIDDLRRLLADCQSQP